MGRPQTPGRAWLVEQSKLGRRAAWPVVAFGLAGTLAAIGQAAIVGAALAAILRGTAPSMPTLAGFAILALLRAGAGFAADRAAVQAGAAARRRLRSAALDSLLAAGPAVLRQRHSAELAAIAVDRIEALDGFFARWLPAATMAMAGPLLVLLAVLWFDPLAALILAAAGLLVPIGMAVSGIGAAAAAQRQFVALERLQVRFLDRVRGIATIVLAGRAEDEAKALAAAAAELRRRTMRVLRVAFLSSAVLDLAAAAALIGLALHYAVTLRPGGTGSPATALAVLLLSVEFFSPLRAFAVAYQDRSHAASAADAIAALPPAPPPAPAQKVRTVQAHGVAVAFESVTVRYDPARPPALDGVSFRVPAGETLVVAGASGAGKSTLLDVLLGFVRPDSGRVTLNGADIFAIVPQALARLVGWVGQNPMLFAASIADNVRFARPEASDAELAEAIAAARLDHVIDTLPDRLDTLLGEGGYGLSGGQAQRVAIARAFLKNAPLLLLDEPTAHLDPTTEAEVLESLKRLAIGRTVVLASHSAAAHAFAGRRLDLRHGRVASAAEPARGAA
jgi:ATP-binding cassette subfamily C protein CydD